MSSRNHWVSAHGPFDRRAACGEEVPNASGRGGLLITGHCKGAPTSPAWLHVCEGCYGRTPFFGVGGVEPHSGRPGWCGACRRWMGDAQVLVWREPVVAGLVQAFVDAASALAG